MRKLKHGLFAFIVILTQFVHQAAALASRPPADPSAPPPPAWVQVVPIAAIFFILYFLMIRPQAKQRRERQSMLGALKKGDKIITQGGIFATIVNLGADYFEVKINDDTKVKIQKSAVADVIVENKDNKPAEPVVVK